MKKFIFALMLAAVWGGQVSAQSSQESLKEYVPVLSAVKAKFWKIDPKLGYAVKNVVAVFTSCRTTGGNPHSW
jgi:hypothetical protein